MQNFNIFVYMKRLFDIASRIKNLSVNVEIKKAIDSNELEVNKLVREQLERGKDRNGRKIKPKYKSDAYAKRKAKMNSKPGEGTPDLKVTGELHEEIGIIVEGDSVYVTSFDEKMKYDSIQQYLPDVFGLQKDNQTKVRILNTKTFIKNVKNITGL